MVNSGAHVEFQKNIYFQNSESFYQKKNWRKDAMQKFLNVNVKNIWVGLGTNVLFADHICELGSRRFN